MIAGLVVGRARQPPGLGQRSGHPAIQTADPQIDRHEAKPLRHPNRRADEHAVHFDDMRLIHGSPPGLSGVSRPATPAGVFGLARRRAGTAGRPRRGRLSHNPRGQ
jgi:hypothetical protein